MRLQVLLLDNHDSFTFNLAQLLEESGLCRFSILTAEQVSIGEVKSFDKILFSPGPGLPYDFPFMFEIIRAYASTKSILGICLGHQAIVEAFGGKLMNLPTVYHGIEGQIHIIEPADILFNGIAPPFPAGLYHSWAADPASLPECLRVTAISNDNIIMGISHNAQDIRGVQFHPESFISKEGQKIISNWLRY